MIVDELKLKIGEFAAVANQAPFNRNQSLHLLLDQAARSFNDFSWVIEYQLELLLPSLDVVPKLEIGFPRLELSKTTTIETVSAWRVILLDTTEPCIGIKIKASYYSGSLMFGLWISDEKFVGLQIHLENAKSRIKRRFETSAGLF